MQRQSKGQSHPLTGRKQSKATIEKRKATIAARKANGSIGGPTVGMYVQARRFQRALQREIVRQQGRMDNFLLQGTLLCQAVLEDDEDKDTDE